MFRSRTNLVAVSQNEHFLASAGHRVKTASTSPYQDAEAVRPERFGERPGPVAA